MNLSFKRGALLLSSIATAVALMACADNETLDLRGVAAVGAPIAGGTVAVTCASGTGSAATNADGSYSVSISEGEGPCLVLVSGTVNGQTVVVSSLVADIGVGETAVVNVNPVTDLVAKAVIQDAGVSLANFFAAPGTTLARLNVTESTITTAGNAAVAQLLAGTGSTLTFADFYSSTSFTASSTGSGSAADQMLDLLESTDKLETPATAAAAPSGSQAAAATNAAKAAVEVTVDPTGATGT